MVSALTPRDSRLDADQIVDLPGTPDVDETKLVVQLMVGDGGVTTDDTEITVSRKTLGTVTPPSTSVTAGGNGNLTITYRFSEAMEFGAVEFNCR